MLKTDGEVEKIVTDLLLLKMVRQAIKPQTVISIFTTFAFLLNLCLEKNGILKMLVIFVLSRARFKNVFFFF